MNNPWKALLKVISNNINNVSIRQGTQPTIEHIWPHFGVDIPFFDGEVRPNNGHWVLWVDKGNKVTRWSERLSPLPRLVQFVSMEAFYLFTYLHQQWCILGFKFGNQGNSWQFARSWEHVLGIEGRVTFDPKFHSARDLGYLTTWCMLCTPHIGFDILFF